MSQVLYVQSSKGLRTLRCSEFLVHKAWYQQNKENKTEIPTHFIRCKEYSYT